MRIQNCCIDADVVENRCDQHLRRYLFLRDATLFLGHGTEPFTANVFVTGIDCDHFGPLLRAGRVVNAQVEIDDVCYRLVDRFRQEHADDRAYAYREARDASLGAMQARVDAARRQTIDVLCRAQRA